MAYPTYNRPQISSAPTYRGGAFREMPTYSGPGWNEGEITGLAQRRAAPGLRALRTQLKRVTRGGGDATRRLSLRDALAGYGQGVGSVVGAASTAAGSEYGDKYSALSAKALNRYRSEAGATGAWNEYATDVAKINYGGEMAEWGARSGFAEKEADLNYARGMRMWEDETKAIEEGRREGNLYDMREKERKADYQRWLDEQEYGENIYQKRRGEAESQKKIDFAWDRWKRMTEANKPIIQTNPMGNYRYLSNTGTGR